MATTSYLLKIDEEEKEKWRKYAKANYNNNLARMIRVAVTQMMDRGHDNIDQPDIQVDKIIRKFEKSNSELKEQMDRIEDMINQHPRLPLGLYLKSRGISEEEEIDQERILKHDF